MKNIAPFIVLVALLAIIGVVLVNWFNYRLKKRLLDAYPGNENIPDLIRDLWRPGGEALKWGLLLLFGGLGLIINSFVPFDKDHPALGFGIEAVCLAAGFLTYYLIIHKKK